MRKRYYLGHHTVLFVAYACKLESELKASVTLTGPSLYFFSFDDLEGPSWWIELSEFLRICLTFTCSRVDDQTFCIKYLYPLFQVNCAMAPTPYNVPRYSFKL